MLQWILAFFCDSVGMSHVLPNISRGRFFELIFTSKKFNLYTSIYGNLFVGYVEEQIFNQFDGPKPELFGRYIDDCLGATSCTKEELEQFIGFVNSFHPALKFTWEISETSVTFLDINISVQDNKLATSVHYKPTDLHSYLLYSSSHPSHI